MIYSTGREKYKEEKYETVIDRERVMFHIKHDGHCWVARAIIDYVVFAIASSVDSSEKAAIQLVSNVEHKIKRIRKHKLDF